MQEQPKGQVCPKVGQRPNVRIINLIFFVRHVTVCSTSACEVVALLLRRDLGSWGRVGIQEIRALLRLTWVRVGFFQMCIRFMWVL